jgi:HD-GYP domain-containing protein (c-di-GMP phosphodiesterase class II)
VRLAELIAPFSLAIDLDIGQPMEHALGACLLAVRLGEVLGFSEEELTDIYYLALVRYIGCTANQHVDAEVLGDDLAARVWVLAIDFGDQDQFMAMLRENVGEGERLTAVLAGFSRMLTENLPAHCEAGQYLARQLGLSRVVQEALTQVYERWDGKGLPRGLKGEEIARPLRVVQLAHHVQIWRRRAGVDAAIAIARQRSGGWYDPTIVEQFCASAPRLLASLDGDIDWAMVLASEPGPRPTLSTERLDSCLEAMADFTDLLLPYFSGHSRGVADLACAAAECYGLPRADAFAVRRAGLVHDLGRLAVPAAIWRKPGPLTSSERERVRLHPYYTERVLARTPALAPLGALAARHHERLDGSGYHVGLRAPLLPDRARILAAADVYHALVEPRPHRAAFTPKRAAAELNNEARAGRLDAKAADAVLMAAGHRATARRRAWPAGLSEREVDVLRLVARGLTNRDIGERLSLSENTVHHHVLHIYGKIGVSTRAAATLFALQHDMLDAVFS